MCNYRKQGELPKLKNILAKARGTAVPYKAQYKKSDKKAAMTVLQRFIDDSNPKHELYSVKERKKEINI